MNFQGRLTTAAGAVVADGLYNMKFALYDAASAGTLKWSEIRETTTRVQITNGLFSTKLGEATPLDASIFASGSLYFQITMATPATANCSTAACASWESPMTTRSLLSTSAYAYNSETLDGLDSTAFGQLSATNVWTGTNTISLTNAAAFKVQNASGTSVLDVDTSGNQTVFGNYNGGTNPVAGKIVLANAANANTISLITGTTSASYTITLPTAVGASGDCLKTSNGTGTLTFGTCAVGAGANTVGALDGGSANATGATITGTTIYLQSASGTNPGLVNTTTQTFAGDKTFKADNFTLQQTATSTNIFTADTVNSKVVLGASTSLTITGSGSRPGSPTDGMVYFDTTTKQLLTYSTAHSKWLADSKTAAFIVAAYDSTQADKDGAQYVVASAEDSTGSGTGTIDGAQIKINTALNAAAAAKGGTVYLAPGTYTLDASVQIPNNVTLAGSGEGTIIQLGDFGATTVNVPMITNVDTTTGTGVTIRDLQIDGRKDRNSAGWQTGIYFEHMGSTVLKSGNIINVHSHRMVASGAEIYNSVGVNIVGGVFENDSTGLYLSAASAMSVTGNNIWGNIYHGIELLSSSQGNTFTSNNIRDNTVNGILVTSSNNNSFASNMITDNIGAGIYIDSSSQAAVTGNALKTNGAQGIFLLGVSSSTVSGNNVYDSGDDAITIQNSSDNTISGNNIQGSAGASYNDGIWLVNSDRNSITSNTIIDPAASVSNYAISVSDSASDKNYLSDNVFNSTAGTATVNDVGTGTIFANQSRAENGGQLTVKTANNASTFQIQNASGTSLLNADTTNSTIAIRAGSDARTLGGELYSGNFSTNWTTTNWNVAGVTTAIHNTGNTSALINTGVAITGGTTYQVGFNLGGTCGTAADTLTVTIGGTSLVSNLPSNTNCIGAGYTYIATASTTAGLTFTPTANWPGTIYNISIKQLSGTINPAFAIANSSGTANLEIRTNSTANDVYIGLNTGKNNVSGANNTGVGTYSLQTNTSGSSNTATGYFSLQANTTGSSNTASGFYSLNANVTGSGNTASGYYSLQKNLAGSNNTGFGESSLASNVTGSSNTAIGYNAGGQEFNGHFATGAALQRASAIGAYAQVQASDSLVLGSVDYGTKVGIGITVPSNLLSVSPVDLNSATITATQSTTTVTASSSIFTTAHVGEILVWADGTTNTITGYTSDTQVTVQNSATRATGSYFRTHIPGFNVTSAGNVFQRTTSATAFQVQNSSATALFGVDTTAANIVQIGSTTTDAAAISFVLDSYNNGTDPAGVNGAMYYNTNTSKFRCYQGGAWGNCLSNLQDAYNNSTSPATITTTAAKGISVTAGAAPTADIMTITNVGQGVATSGVSGLEVNYEGGAAAIEASAIRTDLKPGGTSGSTWNGLRIVANATGPVSGVTANGIKIEGPTAQGAGQETGMYIGTGWDTGLDVQSGGLNLAGYTSGGSPADPPAPAADNLRVYAKSVSGRMLLKTKGPSGVDNPVQPALFGNNIIMYTPTSGTTVTGGFGTLWAKGSSAGTVSTPTPASTAPAMSNQMHRTKQVNAVTTTNQAMGIRANAADAYQFWNGNAAGLGGYFFSSRFIVEAYPAATIRIFAGLSSNTGFEVATSDTVQNNTVGLWHDTTDNATTMNLVTRNAATTTKKTITLSNALAAGNAYDWFMFMKPNDTTVYYRLDDLINGTTYEGNTATTLPVNTVFLAPQVEMSNGTANTTVGVVGIGVVRVYVESDH